MNRELHNTKKTYLEKLTFTFRPNHIRVTISDDNETTNIKAKHMIEELETESIRIGTPKIA